MTDDFSVPPTTLPDESEFDEPTTYETSDPAWEIQDDVPQPVPPLLGLFRRPVPVATDPYAPHDWSQSLAWFAGQSRHRTKDWTGRCQEAARTSYMLAGGVASAWAQWLAVDDDSRHVTSDLSEAPIGAACFSKGTSPFGHVWVKTRPFESGALAGWGTDMVRTGYIDKHHLHAPRDVWGQTILGWTDELCFHDLRLKEKKPPKPKQNKRYKGIAIAIDRLEDARATARSQKDKQDAQALTKEIRRLKRLYATLRRA